MDHKVLKFLNSFTLIYISYRHVPVFASFLIHILLLFLDYVVGIVALENSVRSQLFGIGFGYMLAVLRLV